MRVENQELKKENKKIKESLKKINQFSEKIKSLKQKKQTTQHKLHNLNRERHNCRQDGARIACEVGINNHRLTGLLLEVKKNGNLADEFNEIKKNLSTEEKNVLRFSSFFDYAKENNKEEPFFYIKLYHGYQKSSDKLCQAAKLQLSLTCFRNEFKQILHIINYLSRKIKYDKKTLSDLLTKQQKIKENIGKCTDDLVAIGHEIEDHMTRFNETRNLILKNSQQQSNLNAIFSTNNTTLLYRRHNENNNRKRKLEKNHFEITPAPAIKKRKLNNNRSTIDNFHRIKSVELDDDDDDLEYRYITINLTTPPQSQNDVNICLDMVDAIIRKVNIKNIFEEVLPVCINDTIILIKCKAVELLLLDALNNIKKCINETTHSKNMNNTKNSHIDELPNPPNSRTPQP